MSMFARATCDGCAVATVEIPLPEVRPRPCLIETLRDRHWATPLTGVWLCPACAAITEIDPAPEIVTEAMFDA